MIMPPKDPPAIKISRFLLIVFVLFSFSPSVFSEVIARSGPERVSLVELYTSEGCSSCPPADAWFRGLRNDGGLWHRFVPVAFHVHYWDDLGWKDRFASREFTARQRRLASSWGSGTIYTPGVVLDGRDWRAWRRGSIPRAKGPEPGVLTVDKSGAYIYQAAFKPGEASKKYEINGALLGFDLASDVESGENRGRKLAHDFVVLSWKKSPMNSDSEGVYRAGMSFEPPADLPGRRGVAFWVSEAGQPFLVQAAGTYLAD